MTRAHTTRVRRDGLATRGRSAVPVSKGHRIRSGRPKGDEKLKAIARIQIERIGLDHRVEGEIALS